jgi:hypothetical protein
MVNDDDGSMRRAIYPGMAVAWTETCWGEDSVFEVDRSRRRTETRASSRGLHDLKGRIILCRRPREADLEAQIGDK